MSDQKNDIKSEELREWSKPSVQHKTTLERVQGGTFTTAGLPESPSYAPS